MTPAEQIVEAAKPRAALLGITIITSSRWLKPQTANLRIEGYDWIVEINNQWQFEGDLDRFWQWCQERRS